MVLLFGASAGQAQPSAEVSAKAQRAFDEGGLLMQQGKHNEACQKFEQSQHLEPAMGTQFKMADCYEKIGRLASAWSNFTEVASMARKTGEPERERVALQRADQVVLRLSYMTVNVVEPIPGLVIKRADAEIDRNVWAKAIPIDPGRYVVSATAPGKLPWTTTVEISGDGARFNIDVPPLQDAPVVTGERTTQSGGHGIVPHQRTWAIVSAAAGVVGLGVGVAMVAVAKNHQSQAYDGSCSTDNRCGTDEGADHLSQAKALGDWANLPFGIGLVGLGVGAALWFTAPVSESGTVGVAVSPSRVALTGRF